MNLKQMLIDQAKLDEIIFKNHGITEYPVLKVWNALLVEIGELANEVKHFKYWKKNKKIDRSKILEEFADCLHFALSLENNEGILAKIDLNEFMKKVSEVEKRPENKTDNIDAAFLNAYKECTGTGSPLIAIICLGFALGITLEEMEAEYYKKYEKNLKRQLEGY
jgi:dimeric dUTPase (all-alpha-NTP-PPase superfamily)